jgi:hypothetical protein
LRGFSVGIMIEGTGRIKYAVEIVFNGMMHVRNFMKFGTGVQNLLSGYTYRHTGNKVISYLHTLIL